MGKVQLKIPPFFAYMINPETYGWLVLEREIPEGATVADVLTSLALKNPNFLEKSPLLL